jgi:hypothetical protein
MKKSTDEKEVSPSPTQGEKNVQRQSTEYNEQVPLAHPHGEDGAHKELIPVEHPHGLKTTVDFKTTKKS